MIYIALFLYTIVSTVILISLNEFLGIIGGVINLCLVSIILFFLEPSMTTQEEEKELKLNEIAQKVHVKAKNVTFLFVVSCFVIILAAILLSSEFFKNLQQTAQNLTLILPLLFLIPSLIYYNSALDPSHQLTTKITQLLLIKMENDSSEQITKLRNLIEKLAMVKPDEKKKIESQFYEKGKTLIDELLDKEYSELEPFFFKQNYVELSSYKILEELKKQYLGR